MNQRYYSLDVFRGATVAFMILVNNPGSWANIYAPLDHATWHGCTPTDLVFPFFLFAVGNAMAFVMPRFQEKGTGYFLRKIIKRTLLIFGIGLFLNWCPFVQWKDDQLIFKVWANIRIFGVLQRIAICYFFASLIIYFFKIRGALVITGIILFGYWLLCYAFGSKDDPYSLEGYFGTAIDKTVLGINHMYKGEGAAFDPEGIASTLPAIVQVIFDILQVSIFVRKEKRGRCYHTLL
ncbi:MAG: heparan-alpha-glucosaminide N-acetyltransferase domain-containing protein [Segetibacter sp.]